jgi:hypothetical protein
MVTFYTLAMQKLNYIKKHKAKSRSREKSEQNTYREWNLPLPISRTSEEQLIPFLSFSASVLSSISEMHFQSDTPDNGDAISKEECNLSWAGAICCWAYLRFPCSNSWQGFSLSAYGRPGPLL